MTIGTPTALGTQSTTTGSATSFSITTTATVPAGALIFVAYAACLTSGPVNQPVITSITDSNGNTYSQVDVAPMMAASQVGNNYIYYANSSSSLASGSSITINWGLGGSTLASAIAAAAYCTGVTTLDKHAQNSGNGTGVKTVTTASLSSQPQLIMAMIGQQINGSVTEDGTYTDLYSQISAGSGGLSTFLTFAWKTVSSTSAVSYSPSLGTDVRWGEVIGTFPASVVSGVDGYSTAIIRLTSPGWRFIQ